MKAKTPLPATPSLIECERHLGEQLAEKTKEPKR